MGTETSQALQYIQSKGWQHKPSGDDRVELESCLFCKKSGYGHFYIVVNGGPKDGVWTCHRCGKSGNLYQLKQEMGDIIPGVTTVNSEKKVEPMPDIEAAHVELLSDPDAMDYLLTTRGFSRDIITKQKLGLDKKRFFRETGEAKALMYPYLVNGGVTFVHYRTLPPNPKAFSSLKGWDAPLYNGGILIDGLKSLVLVEGEANVIAALDKGIENIAGVPGANFKKALWIDTLDRLEGLEKIYICYDKDKVGQKAAQVLASRIGVQKCYKVILPDFDVPQEDGTTKKGKDLNEWFVHGGGTKAAFEALLEEATLFDIQGVSNTKDALDDLSDELEGRNSLKPKYSTAWGSLSKLVGFEDGDTIDICAPEKIGKTTFGINLMEYEVDSTGEDGIIICLEMRVTRLARKWVSHVTQTDDSIPKTVLDGEAKLLEMKAAIPVAKKKAADRKGQLYFCNPKIDDVDDMYKLIIDCIRRYGVKWIMVDNIQKLCDLTLKNQAHRTIHLSQISKRLDAITKEYGVKMIRILQPKRIGNNAMATSDDVDGSSQIAKDCDCMIILDRARVGEMSKTDWEQMGYAECETAFDSRMKTTVALSRYSSGGYTTLEFNGSTSTVSEYDPTGRMKLELASKDHEKKADGIMAAFVRKESEVSTPASNEETDVVVLS